MIGQLSALDTPDDDLGSLAPEDLEPDQAVGHQHRRPRLEVGVGEIGDMDAVVVTFTLVGDEDDLLAGVELDRPAGKGAHPQLGPLDVLENGDRLLGFLTGASHPAEERLVGLPPAVGEVEPGDVHPGGYQVANRLVGGHCGAEGGDDLRLALHRGSLGPRPYGPRRR